MKQPRVRPTIQVLMLSIAILAAGFSIVRDQLRGRAGSQAALGPPAVPPPRSGQILLYANVGHAFEAGDGPRVGFTIINDSTEPVPVRLDRSALVAVVLDEHGRVPPSADGPQTPEEGPPPSPTILRGDGRASSEGWSPGDHHRLAPGRYTLSWRFRDGAEPQGREVRSIPASFQVVAPTRARSGRPVVTLSLGETSRFEHGGPIPLIWTLRNETERPITFRSGPDAIDLIVRDETGREMPPTTEGRRLRDAFAAGPVAPEESASRLRPSQTMRSIRGNGLSARYDLPPGRYTAELAYRSADATARSAPVGFSVGPPSGRKSPTKSELIGPPAPPSYEDPATGLRVRVEGDGRTVVATGPDGVERWRRDPFAEAKLRPYRVPRPVIRHLAPASDQQAGRLRAQGRPGPFLGIGYNSSQFGVLDAATGQFEFLGQD